MNTKDIGELGEKSAVTFLKKMKYKIISRNVHASHNEIDIIAQDTSSNTLVFIEVKARTVKKDLYSKYGTPASFVTPKKQKRTIEAARSYLSQNPKLPETMVRFDVIEVYIDKYNFQILKINHIENAFCA